MGTIEEFTQPGPKSGRDGLLGTHPQLPNRWRCTSGSAAGGVGSRSGAVGFF